MKFNEPYDRQSFEVFIRDFLPEDYVEQEKDLAHIDRCKIIREAKELGHCPSLGLSVLEMSHEREKDPRVTIATDAFKLLADYGIDKALIVFKNDDSDNYRLSLLTITLDLDSKNKIVKAFSNARRFSFFLGTGSKTKTPEQQLVRRGRVKGVADLRDRFSLEVVNKEFYLQIASAFDSLIGASQGLVLPGAASSDMNIQKNFSVRLIGRIMFCWFLKQKASVSGALIPEGILSSAAVAQTKGYYHTVLEPLFFEVLNTPLGERGVRSEWYDKVPYLNGGLFNPQHDDYYEIDRGTYSSRFINTLSIPDSWFSEFFKILETYNFTIDENTVFDQELSVDPEMLGRIFENLLAEINPETGTSERKRTGSFYTPRQIVEYMVDQSLFSFLHRKTGIDREKLQALISYDQEDDALNPLTDSDKANIVSAIMELRVLDPACGSGAFPVGMLQKIVFILQHVDPDCSLWINTKLEQVPELWKQRILEYYKSHPPNYVRKLDVIKGSIFGIDIQPIAVEVSRLRCFLTLVVESVIDDSSSNRGIDPLPNLEFKFVCANTLISLPQQTSRGLFDDHAGIAALSQIMADYFSASSSRKEEIKLRFTRAQNEIFRKAIAAFGQSTGELTQKLTFWDPFGNSIGDWFDPEWMFGVSDFDVVIGNPPYLRIQGLQKTQAEMVPMYRKAYESAQGSFDLYALFIERGYRLLHPDGELVYIVPHKFFQASFGKKLRQMIADRKALRQIVKFNAEQVFENPTTYTCLLFLGASPADEMTFTDVTVMDNLTETMNAIATSREIHGVASKSLPVPLNNEWNFQAGVSGDVLKTLAKQPQKLGHVVEKIFQGIATSADKIYVLDVVEEKTTTMRLFSHASNAEVEIEKDLLRPFLMGKDVHRYENLVPRKQVIFPYQIIDDSPRLMEIERIKNNYPLGWAYLSAYKETLSERESGRFRDEWWCFSRPQNMALYGRQKIVTPEIALGGQMTFDEKGFCHTTKVYSFVFKDYLPENPKYWLGLLNSKVLWFFLSSTGYVLRGGYFTFKTNYLTPFPIKRINMAVEAEKSAHDEIVALVDEVLRRKKENATADTVDLESRIDALVYRLYDLNQEEIDTVDKRSKSI